MECGSEETGPTTPVQQAAVEALLGQRALASRQRERLEMVQAAGLGEDIDTIARWSGRTPRTVRRWLTAFRAGGVDALAGAPIPGRPPKANDAYLAALETALDTPPRACGLPFDVWSSRRLSAYLEEQTGIRIAPDGCARCGIGSASRVAGPNTPWTISRTRTKSLPVKPSCRQRGEKVAAAPDRYELHNEDETHVDTTPHLNPKEREWRRLKRDHGGHLAPTLRVSVDPRRPWPIARC